VAALVPAHNEEVCIAATLQSLKEILPQENIYVGSDASTDSTVEIAKEQGCQVVDIWPNRGKANVLVFLLEHFNILKQYKAVLLVDADVVVDKNFFDRALPFFDNPKVAAVIGNAHSKWQDHWRPSWSMFMTAYRIRLWRVLQYTFRYGQTWQYTNVTSIIPGGSSIYRSSVLEQLEINAPGLVIEDYNMTFEVHHRKLGKIAFTPKAFVIDQEPYRLRDYIRQVKRWNLGFWQTIRRHGLWPSFFWLALGVFLIEMFIFSAFFLFVPFLFEWYFLTSFQPFPVPWVASFYKPIEIELFDVLFGLFWADYFITSVVASIEKKPVLLFYGLGFILLRFIDTYLFMVTLPAAFFVKSEGKWISPKRKAYQFY